ncbi:hypothetical protein OQA88_8970 [Cercophora sp. LCS_1]
MENTNNICDFCANELVNLVSLGAYYNWPSETQAVDKRWKRPFRLVTPNGWGPDPAPGAVGLFTPECVVCVILQDGVTINPNIVLVPLIIRFHAKFTQDKGLKGLIRLLTFRCLGLFGHRRLHPVALLGTTLDLPLDRARALGPMNGDKPRSLHDVLRVFVDPDDDSKMKKYISGRPICDPKSEAARRRIQEWLHDCLSSHARCRKGLSGVMRDDRTTASLLPRRLIDVGGEAPNRPRLVDRKGMTGTYVALSYCWESPAEVNPAAVLNSATRQYLMRALPIKDLPPTIRDAIDVTRSLGMAYLWVDRLCIMQDDADEVAAECAAMCDIYDGAILTLAAVGAGTPTGMQPEGLYLSRGVEDIRGAGDNSQFTNPRVGCFVGDKKVGSVYVGRAIARKTDSDLSALAAELDASRWNTRGWTFQERMLSRRIVYFGRHQLYWECQKDVLNEDGTREDLGSGRYNPEKGDTDFRTGTSKGSLSKSVKLSSALKPLGHLRPILPKSLLGLRPEFLDPWPRILREYSHRHLTVGQDKLRAIEGVAQALRLRLSRKDYSYGVWLDNLAMQLLWLGAGPLTPTSTFRAPSWSWASVDGQLSFPSFVRASTRPRFHSVISSPAFTSESTTPSPERPVLTFKAKAITGEYVVGRSWRGPRFMDDAWATSMGVRLLRRGPLPSRYRASLKPGQARFYMEGKWCGLIQFDFDLETRPQRSDVKALLVAQDTYYAWEGPYRDEDGLSLLDDDPVDEQDAGIPQTTSGEDDETSDDEDEVLMMQRDDPEWHVPTEIYHFIVVERVGSQDQNSWRRIGMGEAIHRKAERRFLHAQRKDIGYPLHRAKGSEVSLV